VYNYGVSEDWRAVDAPARKRRPRQTRAVKRRTLSSRGKRWLGDSSIDCECPESEGRGGWREHAKEAKRDNFTHPVHWQMHYCDLSITLRRGIQSYGNVNI
jgi:hypothetical protein